MAAWMRMHLLAIRGALPRAEGDETALGTSRYILPPGIRENLEAPLADSTSVFGGDDEDDGPRGAQDGLAGAELNEVPAHSRSDDIPSENKQFPMWGSIRRRAENC